MPKLAYLPSVGHGASVDVSVGASSRLECLVLIATSARQIRKRWRAVLQGAYRVHEVADFLSLQRSLQHKRPSVLLLDDSLSKSLRNGGLMSLQERSPETKIVLFTRTPHLQQAISALKNGARGYCHRNLTPGLLRNAIDAVQKNEFWLGRKLTSRLLQELAKTREEHEDQSAVQPEVDLECLSPREQETAELVGKGLTNKEIACRLQISERTVKAHLASIFSKLGVESRLQLAILVTKQKPSSQKPFSN